MHGHDEMKEHRLWDQKDLGFNLSSVPQMVDVLLITEFLLLGTIDLPT